jgi:type II secretion system protein D
MGEVQNELGRVDIQQIAPDQFILRGPLDQVEALSKLLEDLDRIGGLAESDIRIVALAHAEAGQLAKVLTSVYQARLEVRSSGTTTTGSTSTSQLGKVTFIPIAQPNAVIIVARKVDLADIAERVKEIDLGCKDGERFRVFPLKQANPANVAAKLKEFFAASGAAATTTAATTTAGSSGTNLRTFVEAVADPRTNSVLVYAGPSDMKQIAQLIEVLDGEVNLNIAEIRYFSLKNAVASEVASLLQQAIVARANAAAASSTTAAQQQPFQQQQQFGGTGQQTAQITSVASSPLKSARLKLLTRDATGTLVESGILDDLTISADPRTNGLLVTAPKDTMGLVAELIKQIDAIPNPGAELKVFELKNADASAMQTTLQQFFTQQTSGGGQAGFTAQGGVNLGGGGAGQSGTQPRSFILPGVESQLSLTPLSFSVDTRTNSLLVIGAPNDMLVVEALVRTLDNNRARERQNFVYRLNTLTAADASAAIDSFIQGQAQGLTNLGNALGGAAQTGLLTLQQQIAQDVVVVAEESSNQLIISASPRYFDEVLRMIQVIDRRPPQVVVQCLIAEVQLTDNEEFGVEFGLQTSPLFDRNIITDNQLVPGINFNTVNALPSLSTANFGAVGLQGLSNFSLGRGSSDGFGGLIFSASSENVSVLLRALKRQQRLDVLSRPQISVLDSKQADLNIGQRVPLLTNSTVQALGNITNSFTYEDVGINLGVSAVIGPDGVVVMNVTPEISSIAPGTGVPIAVNAAGQVTASTPIINQTRIQTTIVAADGQTVVVGGLITRQRSQDVRKIPKIGDIPLIGHLFRTDFYQVQKRELIFVLTPRIVYSDADIERVKEEETRRIDWCLPDVYAVHGDPYMPAVPSKDGIDRAVNVLGMEIPEKAKPPAPQLPYRPLHGGSATMPAAPEVLNMISAPNSVPTTPATTPMQPQQPNQPPSTQAPVNPTTAPGSVQQVIQQMNQPPAAPPPVQPVPGNAPVSSGMQSSSKTLSTLTPIQTSSSPSAPASRFVQFLPKATAMPVPTSVPAAAALPASSTGMR